MAFIEHVPKRNITNRHRPQVERRNPIRFYILLGILVVLVAIAFYFFRSSGPIPVTLNKTIYGAIKLNDLRDYWRALAKKDTSKIKYYQRRLKTLSKGTIVAVIDRHSMFAKVHPKGGPRKLFFWVFLNDLSLGSDSEEKGF